MLLTADWVIPINGDPIADGAIAVLKGKIAEVGPAVQLRARWVGATGAERGHADGVVRAEGSAYAEGSVHEGGSVQEADVRSFPGCVLMPGLVNAHSHLEYSAFRGFSHPCGFGEWMLRLLLARRKLAPEDYAISARWGARECVRAGITCTADTSFEGWTSARAAGEAGLRARVHLEVIGLNDEDLPDTMRRMEERLAGLRGSCGPFIEPGLSPHAPYTVSQRLYRELARFARREGLRLVTHVAESKAEVELLEQGTGAIAQAYKAARLWRGHRWQPPGVSPVSFLDRSEVLGPELLAVHCVQVDEEDIARLAWRRAPVAHCPRSNQRLQCGTAPVAELRRAGVVTGLGTDSLASNESLDLFAEMRAAVELSRARAALAARAPSVVQARSPDAQPVQGATALSALRTGAPWALTVPVLDEAAALRMATIEGAAALGLDHAVGSLETVKDADIIAVRLPDSEVDAEGLPSALVAEASASDVRLAIVAGRVVFDGEAASLGQDDLDGALAAVRTKLGLEAVSK